MAKEVRLDCLGEACPVPLIKTQKKMANVAVGDTLIVEVDHSCAIKNVPEWARKEGFNCEVDEVDDGQWEIIIEKTK
ncbi:sulfurtransferase TusA family protein [Tissierella sp. MSJ-40]|jgi:TusA-related sulfurtransferase|uniref:Sulfurtransferase TusA family protein n=1 Tax=Tissierella simiarum TaxID=2841534 RepID=A0ABS6E9S9_9FIRM|nr:sulfurtransferase TusA family protein [Tissierella simiarum]MBU5439687.1 sulfurtransferase TusA family protein [Tissierella simiarum]